MSGDLGANVFCDDFQMIDLSKLLFSLLATQTGIDYAFIDYPCVKWLCTISHKLRSTLMVFSKGKTLRESGVCRCGCQSRNNGWQI